MKKLAFFVVVTVLCIFSTTIFAANGDVIGHIYSTDILAYVNGEPIDSYNIGGRTVVIAEDLESYGFNCDYDEQSRTLRVESYFYGRGKDIAEIARGKVGKILGDVYQTDIKVFYNNIEIDGYNIGGRTAICLENMGDLTDSPNLSYGYSKYLGKSVWDEENRTIAFETFATNYDKVTGMLSRVSYYFIDNVLYAYPDENSIWLEILPPPASEGSAGESNYSEDFNKDVLSPLYLEVKGEKTEVGVAVVNPNNSYHTLMYFYDVDKTLSLTKQEKFPKMAYDEAIEYFSAKYDIVKRLDNEEYTVLMLKDEDDGVYFAYISKNGGFVVDSFFSGYGDKTVEIWFDEERENVVWHSVTPFAGPHGATTMSYESALDMYDYE